MFSYLSFYGVMESNDSEERYYNYDVFQMTIT